VRTVVFWFGGGGVIVINFNFHFSISLRQFQGFYPDLSIDFIIVQVSKVLFNCC